VVHVSTVEGARLIRAAQERGVDVSGETCPHYLLYVEDDLERLGGIAKCAPPLRSPGDREGLWRMLDEGRLPMVVSDHSPSTLALKQGEDFFALWGGISGCQSTRQLLLGRALPAPLVAAVTSTNIARRFGLANKGEIAPGFDADLWLVDLDDENVVRREDLLYLNRFSVHEGRPIRGRTVMTMLRGEAAGKNRGRLLRPER
jgi:allantoinase